MEAYFRKEITKSKEGKPLVEVKGASHRDFIRQGLFLWIC